MNRDAQWHLLLRGADVSSGGGRSRHRHCGVGGPDRPFNCAIMTSCTPVINNSPQTH